MIHVAPGYASCLQSLFYELSTVKYLNFWLTLTIWLAVTCIFSSQLRRSWIVVPFWFPSIFFSLYIPCVSIVALFSFFSFTFSLPFFLFFRWCDLLSSISFLSNFIITLIFYHFFHSSHGDLLLH